MTALGQVLIVISVLACGIIYGTDVFSAIVLRPARISAPINARLTAASQRGELPPVPVLITS